MTELKVNDPDDPLLKVGQVADIFQVGKRTVHQWIKDGKLNAVKVNNYNYMVNESEVKRFANERYGS